MCSLSTKQTECLMNYFGTRGSMTDPKMFPTKKRLNEFPRGMYKKNKKLEEKTSHKTK